MNSRREALGSETHGSGSTWIARVSRPVAALLLAMLVLGPAAPVPANAADAATLEGSARGALESLYRQNPGARALRDKATGVLVFPNMVKAGFLFGGQIGEGVLFKRGRSAGYYNSVAASYGLQAGAKSFGYALFFMNAEALSYLDKSAGFQLGVGPSLVVMDAGMAASLTSAMITEDIYAFVFNQTGIMGGLGIEGSKITKINKK